MLTFRYQAIDSGGVRSQGEIDAADRDSAIALLAERGLMCKDFREDRAGIVPRVWAKQAWLK